MRAALTLPALALVGCGSGVAPPPPGDAIACAPAGAPLRPDCTLSRTGDTLIVRQADGAFRRLAMEDGRPVSADGAEAVSLAAGADHMNVTIGGWTYRLPPAIP